MIFFWCSHLTLRCSVPQTKEGTRQPMLLSPTGYLWRYSWFTGSPVTSEQSSGTDLGIVFVCCMCSAWYMTGAQCINPRRAALLGRHELNQIIITKAQGWFSGPLVLERGVCNRGKKRGGSDSLSPFQFLGAQKRSCICGENKGYAMWGKVVCCWWFWETEDGNQFERMIFVDQCNCLKTYVLPWLFFLPVHPKYWLDVSPCIQNR